MCEISGVVRSGGGGGALAMVLSCAPSGITDPGRDANVPSSVSALGIPIPLEVRAGLRIPDSRSTQKPYVKYYSPNGTLIQARELTKAELQPYGLKLREAFRSRPARAIHEGALVSFPSSEQGSLIEPWTENGFEYSLESSVTSGQQVTVLWQDSVAVNAGWYALQSSGDSTIVTSVTFQNYYPDGGLLLEVGFPASALDEINGGGGEGEGEPETASTIGCIGSIFALVGTTIGVGVAVKLATAASAGTLTYWALRGAVATWTASLFFVFSECGLAETAPPMALGVPDA